MISKDWRHRSRCLTYDPELFFDPETEFEAVAVCFLCTVRTQCLNWAIDEKIKWGVWGGTTELERRQINTPRRRVKCPHCAGDRIYVENGVELCLSCGLSWRT